jgi:hypothetical protein
MNDLLFAQGQDNLAGLVDKIYICASEDILTVPALTAATSLKTAADIVCKTGKKFAQIYITDETGKVETKSVGPRDGKGRETVLSGRHPALGHELEDLIRQCQNTPSVLIYRLARNGKMFALGLNQPDITTTALSTDIPAYFETGDASSGEKRADQNGALLSWKFGCAHGPIEYGGQLASLLLPGV